LSLYKTQKPTKAHKLFTPFSKMMYFLRGGFHFHSHTWRPDEWRFCIIVF